MTIPNTDTDQVGTLITTEFGASPLSFPKGVANVAPYVSGAARTYAGVTEDTVVGEPALLHGPDAGASVVEATAEAPVTETVVVSPSADNDNSVASASGSEIHKIVDEVKTEAEHIAEEAKDVEEKVVTEVEAAVKDVEKAV